MKKIISTLTVLAFIANYSTAQDSDEGKDYRNSATFGFKAGANLSNVYDSKGEDFKADSKLGFVGGGFLAIPFTEAMGIQLEMLVSQKGFSANGTILGSPYDFKRTTTYLDVPILFQLKAMKSLSIVAGPQFSYLMKQKDVFSNSAFSFLQEKEFENDNIRVNILGFVAGLDININHLVIGARVAWDFANNRADGTSSTPRYKNVWAQATIGFRF